MFTVSRLPFLVTVTKRRQVAQIRGCPVYVVTSVAVTPCARYEDADAAVAKTCIDLELSTTRVSEEDDSESEEEVEIPPPTDEVDDFPLSSSQQSKATSTTPSNHVVETEIAKNVIKQKGSYGRFSTRWFSSGGWTLEQRRSLGMTANGSGGTLGYENAGQDGQSAEELEPEPSQDKLTTEPTSLLPKFLRTVRLMFGKSSSFYYSYDCDKDDFWAGAQMAG